VQTFLPYADFEQSARSLDTKRLGKQRVESGFGDTCAATIGSELTSIGIAHVRTQAELADAGALPPWLGDDDFHRSHRSALVRKDPDFYGPKFPDVPDDLPYVWPVPPPGDARSADTGAG
jgi:hypothetical protein